MHSLTYIRYATAKQRNYKKTHVLYNKRKKKYNNNKKESAVVVATGCRSTSIDIIT